MGQWRLTTTDSRHSQPRYPNLIRHLCLTHPNQVWCGDITYIRLGARFLYLAVILDAYTRGVRGWALGSQVDQMLTLTALQQALHQGKPHFFHSDQGVQHAAQDHTRLLLQHQVRISMSDTGQPTQNALVERFVRLLKEWLRDKSWQDDQKLATLLDQFLVEYNDRPHQGLSIPGPSPNEFANRIWLL